MPLGTAPGKGLILALARSGVSLGCVYELLAQFHANNQEYTNGQVLTTAEGVDAGQLTIVELDGSTRLVDKEMVYTAQSTPLWGDLGHYSEAITRTMGKMVAWVQEVSLANSSAIGWTNVQSADLSNAGNREAAYQITGGALLYARTAGASPAVLLDTISLATEYEFAIVLGGYDASQVPWYTGASYLYGAAFFIRGGTYTDWTLLWRTTLHNTNTLYHAFGNVSANLTLDDIRVPQSDYSSALVPIALSTFDAPNGTSLDAITPEVGGTWTENSGAWDIQGNRANQTVASHQFATIDTGESDHLIRCTVQTPVNGFDGLVVRYQDTNNLWGIRLAESGNAIEIYERNAGVFTRRDITFVVISPATDYELTGVQDGQEITMYLDGNTRAQYASAAFLQAATRAGLWAFGANGQWDNFHVHRRDGTQYDVLDTCEPTEPTTCIYELLAQWAVGDQGFADAQTLTSAEGVDAGILTIRETDGAAAVVSQVIQFSGKGTNNWDTLGAKLSTYGLERTLGKALRSKITAVSGPASLALMWHDSSNYTQNNPINSDHAAVLGATGINHMTDDGFVNSPVGSATANTEYEFALVLGGYNNTGEAYYTGTAAASLYGAAMFVKGGTEYPDWTLLWRWAGNNTSSLYPAIAMRYSGSVGEVDDLSVSDLDYKEVLEPINFSSFDAPNGTSLDAITPEVGGAWTEQNGDWDIQGNRANSVAPVPVAPYFIATVESGFSDVFIRCMVSLTAIGNGAAGIAFRYRDNNNFWIAYPSDGANTFYLYEINGGVATARDSQAVAVAASTDYEVTAVTDGVDIAAYLDGKYRLTFNSAFNQSETIVGLRARRDSTVFDNFHVSHRSDTQYDKLNEVCT